MTHPPPPPPPPPPSPVSIEGSSDTAPARSTKPPSSKRKRITTRKAVDHDSPAASSMQTSSRIFPVPFRGIREAPVPEVDERSAAPVDDDFMDILDDKELKAAKDEVLSMRPSVQFVIEVNGRFVEKDLHSELVRLVRNKPPKSTAKYPVFLSRRCMESCGTLPTVKPPAFKALYAGPAYWESVCPQLLALLDCSITSFRLCHLMDMLRSTSTGDTLEWLDRVYTPPFKMRHGKYRELIKAFRSVLETEYAERVERLPAKYRATAPKFAFPQDAFDHPVFFVTFMRCLFSFRFQQSDIPSVVFACAEGSRHTYRNLRAYIARREVDRSLRNAMFTKEVHKHTHEDKRRYELVTPEERKNFKKAQYYESASRRIDREVLRHRNLRGAKAFTKARHSDRDAKYEMQSGGPYTQLQDYGFTLSEIQGFLKFEFQGPSEAVNSALEAIGKAITGLLSTSIANAIKEVLFGEGDSVLLLQGRVMAVLSTIVAALRQDVLSFALAATTAIAMYYSMDEMKKRVTAAVEAASQWISSLTKPTPEFTIKVEPLPEHENSLFPGRSIQVDHAVEAPLLKGDLWSVSPMFYDFIQRADVVAQTFDLSTMYTQRFLPQLQAAYVACWGSLNLQPTDEDHFAHLEHGLRWTTIKEKTGTALHVEGIRPTNISLDAVQEGFFDSVAKGVSFLGDGFSNMIAAIVGTDDNSANIDEARRVSAIYGAFNQRVKAIESITSIYKRLIAVISTVCLGFDATDLDSVLCSRVVKDMLAKQPKVIRSREDAGIIIENYHVAQELLIHKQTPGHLRTLLLQLCSLSLFDKAQKFLDCEVPRQFPLSLFFVGPAGTSKSTNMRLFCHLLHDVVEPRPKDAVINEHGLRVFSPNSVFPLPSGRKDTYWTGYHSYLPDDRGNMTGTFAIVADELFSSLDHEILQEQNETLIRIVNEAPFYAPSADIKDKGAHLVNSPVFAASSTVSGLSADALKTSSYEATTRRFSFYIEPLITRGQGNIPVTSMQFRVASMHYSNPCLCGFCQPDDPPLAAVTEGTSVRQRPHFCDTKLTSFYEVSGAVLLRDCVTMYRRFSRKPKHGQDRAVADLVESLRFEQQGPPSAPVPKQPYYTTYITKYGITACSYLDLAKEFAVEHKYSIAACVVIGCAVLYGAAQLWDAFAALDAEEQGTSEKYYVKERIANRVGALKSNSHIKFVDVTAEQQGNLDISPDQVQNRICAHTSALTPITIVTPSGREILAPAVHLGLMFLVVNHNVSEPGEYFVKFNDTKTDAGIPHRVIGIEKIPNKDLAVIFVGGHSSSVQHRKNMLNSLLYSVSAKNMIGKPIHFVRPPMVSRHSDRAWLVTKAFVKDVVADVRVQDGSIPTKHSVLYEVETAPGDCGCVAFGPSENTVSPWLMHTAGSRQANCGIGAVIDRLEVETAMRALSARCEPAMGHVDLPNAVPTPTATFQSFAIEPPVPVKLGETVSLHGVEADWIVEDKVPHLSTRQSITATSLKGWWKTEFPEVGDMYPSHTTPRRDENGETLCDFVKECTEKFSRDAHPMPDDFMEIWPIIRSRIMDCYPQPNHPHRVLTLAEAILGEWQVTQFDGSIKTLRMGPLDGKASPGYPLKSVHTRADLVRVDRDPDGTPHVFVHEKLLEAIESMIVMMERGQRPDVYACACQKVETLPTKDTPCGLKKTRSIYVMDLAVLIVCRMYFGAVCPYFCFSHTPYDTQGINVHNVAEVKLLLSHLHGPELLPGETRKYIYGDFQKWDTTVPRWVMLLAWNLLSDWIGGSEEERRVRQMIASILAYCPRVLREYVFDVSGYQVSGFFFTTGANNLYNLIIQFTSYAYIIRENIGDVEHARAKLIELLHRIWIVVNGDDSISSPRFEVTPERYADMIKRLFGMVYTSPTKDGPPLMCSDFSFDYLSRTFSFDDLGPHAPLGLRQLFNSIAWCQQRDVGLWRQSFQNFLLELSHYPEPFYNRVTETVRKHPGFAVLHATIPSYHAALAKRMSGNAYIDGQKVTFDPPDFVTRETLWDVEVEGFSEVVPDVPMNQQEREIYTHILAVPDNFVELSALSIQYSELRRMRVLKMSTTCIAKYVAARAAIQADPGRLPGWVGPHVDFEANLSYIRVARALGPFAEMIHLLSWIDLMAIVHAGTGYDVHLLFEVFRTVHPALFHSISTQMLPQLNWPMVNDYRPAYYTTILTEVVEKKQSFVESWTPEMQLHGADAVIGTEESEYYIIRNRARDVDLSALPLGQKAVLGRMLYAFDIMNRVGEMRNPFQCFEAAGSARHNVRHFEMYTSRHYGPPPPGDMPLPALSPCQDAFYVPEDITAEVEHLVQEHAPVFNFEDAPVVFTDTTARPFGSSPVRHQRQSYFKLPPPQVLRETLTLVSQDFPPPKHIPPVTAVDSMSNAVTNSDVEEVLQTTLSLEGHPTIQVAPSGVPLLPNMGHEELSLFDSLIHVTDVTWPSTGIAGSQIVNFDVGSHLSTLGILDDKSRFDFFTYDRVRLFFTCAISPLVEGEVAIVASPEPIEDNLHPPTWSFYPMVYCGKTENETACTAEISVEPLTSQRILNHYNTFYAYFAIYVVTPLRSSAASKIFNTTVRVFAKIEGAKFHHRAVTYTAPDLRAVQEGPEHVQRIHEMQQKQLFPHFDISYSTTGPMERRSFRAEATVYGIPVTSEWHSTKAAARSQLYEFIVQKVPMPTASAGRGQSTTYVPDVDDFIFVDNTVPRATLPRLFHEIEQKFDQLKHLIRTMDVRQQGPEDDDEDETWVRSVATSVFNEFSASESEGGLPMRAATVAANLLSRELAPAMEAMSLNAKLVSSMLTPESSHNSPALFPTPSPALTTNFGQISCAGADLRRNITWGDPRPAAMTPRPPGMMSFEDMSKVEVIKYIVTFTAGFTHYFPLDPMLSDWNNTRFAPDPHVLVLSKADFYRCDGHRFKFKFINSSSQKVVLQFQWFQDASLIDEAMWVATDNENFTVEISGSKTIYITVPWASPLYWLPVTSSAVLPGHPAALGVRVVSGPISPWSDTPQFSAVVSYQPIGLQWRTYVDRTFNVPLESSKAEALTDVRQEGPEDTPAVSVEEFVFTGAKTIGETGLTALNRNWTLRNILSSPTEVGHVTTHIPTTATGTYSTQLMNMKFFLNGKFTAAGYHPTTGGTYHSAFGNKLFDDFSKFYYSFRSSLKVDMIFFCAEPIQVVVASYPYDYVSADFMNTGNALTREFFPAGGGVLSFVLPWDYKAPFVTRTSVNAMTAVTNGAIRLELKCGSVASEVPVNISINLCYGDDFVMGTPKPPRELELALV